MTEPKFTPGPWRVEPADTTFTVVSADGIQVVRTSWHSHLRKPYPLKAEAFANARLVASAPEMYEALKEARGWVVLAEDLCRDNSKALALIDAALSKAEG